MKKLSKTSSITKEQILQIFNEGKRLALVADKLGISMTTLRKLVYKFDIEELVSDGKHHKKKNMIGKTFGFLEVLRENGKDHQGRIVWECRCICGEIVPCITGKYLRNGSTKSCGCKGKDYSRVIPGYFYSGIRARAIRSGHSWEVDYQFLCDLFEKQNGKCALTGRNLQFSETKKDFEFLRTTTASLDRIDSNGEYTKDNVQWLHKSVNKFKSNLTQEEVFKISKEIFLYLKDKYE